MLMKRLFTSLSLFCLALLAAHAQDAEFRYHGQALENGATVTITGEIDPIFGDIECNTNPANEAANGLVFVNKSKNEWNCVAKLTIESNTMAPSQIQWCMGGECTMIKESSLTKNFSQKAGASTPVQFDCLPTKEGELVASIQVTANLKNYLVKVRFVYDPAHIGQVSDGKTTPTAFYTIDGRRMTRQRPGLGLVRMGDGSLHKIFTSRK